MKSSLITYLGFLENQAHLRGHDNLVTTCYLVVKVKKKAAKASRIVFHCSFSLETCNCFSVHFFPTLYHF